MRVCFFGGQVKASAPPQVKGLKQNSDSDVAWKDLGPGVRYEVSMSQDGKRWNTRGTIRYAKYPFPYLAPGKSYYIRVRGFIEVRNQNKFERLYGPYSETLEFVTAPEMAKNVRETAAAATSMTVKWDAAPGATEYVVKYNKGGNNPKIVRIKSTTIKLKNLSVGTNYRVWVIPARKTADGKYCAETSTWNDRGRLLKTVPGKVTGIDCSRDLSALMSVSIPSSEEERVKNVIEGYKVEIWTADKKKDTKITSSVKKKEDSGWSFYSNNFVKNTFAKYNMVKIRACAYITIHNNKKVYGKWSDWKYVCPQPDVTKIQKSGKGLALSWKKISGADR